MCLMPREAAEEIFKNSPPVQSAEDLARDGIFDDEELEEFLTDLNARRQTDLA